MANEKRLISLDEALKSTRDEIYWTESQQAAVRFFLVQQPRVDAVEVVHGRWIERPLDNFRKYEVKCSECGFVGIGNYDQYLEPYDFNYCPNCGAKMDGEFNAID